AIPLLLAGCDLQQEVEIDLPAYERKLAVEAYLEPGQPYRLVLTETQSYFDSVSLPLVQDAEVIIRHGAEEIRLQPGLFVDTTNLKVYNWAAEARVPLTSDEVFTLDVRDGRGRTLSGTTRLLPPVRIDTVEWRFDEDTAAYVLTRFQDPAGVPNYYRLIINRDSLSGGADVDFVVDDELLDGQQVPLGTGFNYAAGDTLFVRLYHLDPRHFRFLETAFDARNSNGNPFAQPAPLVSGVNGGVGVFTCLSYDQRRIIVGE
ncbi:MAG: DUF4249 domain-containing protein, partial [Catalinimonas sp.]